MSDHETKNFFENPNGGWAGPAAGAFLGALFGENGFGGVGGGGRQPAVTPDQLGTAIGNLQGSLQRDQLQSGIAGVNQSIAGLGTTITEAVCGSTAALGAGIVSVKDAIQHASTHNQLSLCNLGHSVESGFAGVNQNILLQGAQSRELALQQALDAERARATELRISLSEHKNQAGHASTQVLLNQIIAGKA